MIQNKTYMGYRPKEENIIKLSEYVSKRGKSVENPAQNSTLNTKSLTALTKQSPLKNKRF